MSSANYNFLWLLADYIMLGGGGVLYKVLDGEAALLL